MLLVTQSHPNYSVKPPIVVNILKQKKKVFSQLSFIIYTNILKGARTQETVSRGAIP